MASSVQGCQGCFHSPSLQSTCLCRNRCYSDQSNCSEQKGWACLRCCDTFHGNIYNEGNLCTSIIPGNVYTHLTQEKLPAPWGLRAMFGKVTTLPSNEEISSACWSQLSLVIFNPAVFTLRVSTLFISHFCAGCPVALQLWQR